jgi:hypothetical protein
MSKHTPGPWKATKFNEHTGLIDPHCIYIEPKVAVVERSVSSPEVDLANAHLIAAAPDLLEALELCRSELAAMKSEIGFRGTTIDVINTADAAIARARGDA